MTPKVASVRSQLEQILRGRIEQGHYAADSRLPAEHRLAGELGVSRPTLRTTLARLESEGLITRRQGDGTYVNQHAFSVDATPKSYWNFSSLIEESGRTARSQLLSVRQRLPTEPEASLYKLPVDRKVIVTATLFTANGQPVIHSTGILPLFEAGDLADYDFNQPIHVIVKAYGHQEISYSISDISAAFAPRPVARQLKLAPRTPVLKFVDTFYNARNQALVHGVSYFCDELIRMRVAHSWG